MYTFEMYVFYHKIKAEVSLLIYGSVFLKRNKNETCISRLGS